MIYIIVLPLLLLVVGFGFISIFSLILLIINYLRDRNSWLSTVTPRILLGSVLGALVFFLVGYLLKLSWVEPNNTQTILEIMWGYFALAIFLIALTAKEKKILSGLVSILPIFSGLYLLSFAVYFFGKIPRPPLMKFLSDPAGCIKVEGGLGPDIRCEWGSPTILAVLWFLAFFVVIYLFAVIKRKRSEHGKFPKILLLFSILLTFVLSIFPLNAIYQSSPQYEKDSFRNRVDSFIPENREAKKVGQQMKNLRTEERLELSGKSPYKDLVIEVDLYLPKDGYYRFEAWNTDKDADGLTHLDFINETETDSFKVVYLKKGTNKLKYVFSKQEKYKDEFFIKNITNKSLFYKIIIEYFSDPTYDSGTFANQPPPVAAVEVKTKYYTLADWKN